MMVARWDARVLFNGEAVQGIAPSLTEELLGAIDVLIMLQTSMPPAFA